MNKIVKIFYDKYMKRVNNELDERGLLIKDNDKFHKYVLKQARKDIIYTILLFGLFLYILLKQFGVIQ